MNLKLDSDYDLPLKKTLELHHMIVVIRSAFYEDNKYSPQVCLDGCLHKLQMLYFEKIGVFEDNDVLFYLFFI